MTISSWELKAKEKQQRVLDQIPEKWRLAKVPSPKEAPNARDFIDTLCTAEENRISDLSAIEVAKEIADGKLTAVVVCETFCKRSAYAHQLLNCCIEIFYEKALERAKELDDYFKSSGGKTVGPLHGVPISLKDQLNVEGIETTLGWVSWLGRVATKSDVSVLCKILANAGAVFYVKTTVPPGLMAGETVSNLHGRTLNAINRNLSCGGSSGGEGALVGARGAIWGIGTDIGGSIRIPSGFQGLYGLRPSFGRISYCKVSNSMEGQEIMPSVIGPMCTHLEDTEFFIKTTIDSQPWLYDPKCIPIPWRGNEIRKELTGKKLCFGIKKWDTVVMPHPPVLRAMDMVKEALIKAGHEVFEWQVQYPQEIYTFAAKLFNADKYKELKSELLEGETMSANVAANEVLEAQTTETVNDYWDLAREKYILMQKILNYWQSTQDKTSTGRPVDGVISPLMISATANFGDYAIGGLSYTCPQNVLDLSTITCPVTKADPNLDPVNKDYKPISELDEKAWKLYDPALYAGGQVSVQLSTKRYEEEKAIFCCEALRNALKNL